MMRVNNYMITMIYNWGLNKSFVKIFNIIYRKGQPRRREVLGQAKGAVNTFDHMLNIAGKHIKGIIITCDDSCARQAIKKFAERTNFIIVIACSTGAKAQDGHITLCGCQEGSPVIFDELPAHAHPSKNQYVYFGYFTNFKRVIIVTIRRYYIHFL